MSSTKKSNTNTNTNTNNTKEEKAMSKNEVSENKAGEVMEIMNALTFGEHTGLTNVETAMNRDGELAYVVTNREKDGTETTSLYVPTKETETALKVLSALRNASQLTELAQARYLAFVYTKEVWKDMGYKSYALFAKDYCGMNPDTARQRARVGKWFVTSDGPIEYIRAFLDDVPFTNLYQLLSLMEQLYKESNENHGEALDKLRDLVREGKLHLKNQQAIKDDVATLMGREKKDGKQDGKQDGKSTEQALPDAVTAFGIIESAVAEKLVDGDDVDTVKQALALVKSIIER